MDIIKNTPKIPENIPYTAIEVPRDKENIVTPPVVGDEKARIGFGEEITLLARQNVTTVDARGYINVIEPEGIVKNPFTDLANRYLSKISK